MGVSLDGLEPLFSDVKVRALIFSIISCILMSMITDRIRGYFVNVLFDLQSALIAYKYCFRCGFMKSSFWKVLLTMYIRWNWIEYFQTWSRGQVLFPKMLCIICYRSAFSIVKLFIQWSHQAWQWRCWKYFAQANLICICDFLY